MANYLTFPMDYLNVTQNYNGTVSHKPHTSGNIVDYPIDIAGRDAGCDAFYCPCDELKIVKLYGYKAKGTNTIFARSTTKVDFADGTKDYACFQITHPNDSDMAKLKKGQTFKRGEKICNEGIDGAHSNHIHLSIGKGDFKVQTKCWEQNSNGKWVIYTTNGAIKPEKAIYKTEKNIIKNTGGLTFKMLPDEPKKTVLNKSGTVTASALNVREGNGTDYKVVGMLHKGDKVKVAEIRGNWGEIGIKRWVCMDYIKLK